MNSESRRLDVLHAASDVHAIGDLIECQISYGMRPYVLTEHSDGMAAIWSRDIESAPMQPKSLLNSWSEVRQWRKAFDSAGTGFDVAHVHCFPAGMTCARTGESFVYDLRAFVEQLATPSDLSYEHSWMGRSFRVAEHFVLTRAAAVVVHAPLLKDAVVERGVKPEVVHVIPDPVADDGQPVLRRSSLAVHAPDAGVVGAGVEAASEVVAVLSAFKAALEARPGLRLYVLPDPSLLQLAQNCAASLGVSNQVVWEIHPPQVGDVVVPGSIARGHRSLSYAMSCASETVVTAMNRSCAVLAADSPCNRAVSQNGEALMWFAADQPNDLAGKLVNVVRDDELRDRYAHSSRVHIQRTRSYPVIGSAYAELYRSIPKRDIDTRITLPISVNMRPAFGRV